MTTEKAARDYAYRVSPYEPYPASLFYNAFIAGANFVKSCQSEALASQWVSVKDGLPEIGELVLAAHIGFVTAIYDGADWYDTNGHLIRPHYWLPIPPLKGGDA